MLFFLKNSCKKFNRAVCLSVKHDSAGQVMSEYAVMIVFCLLMALAVMVFGHYFSINGWRMITQVGVGYP